MGVAELDLFLSFGISSAVWCRPLELVLESFSSVMSISKPLSNKSLYWLINSPNKQNHTVAQSRNAYNSDRDKGQLKAIREQKKHKDRN